MLRIGRAAAGLVLATGGAVVGAGPAAAVCTTPELSLHPAAAPPGSTLTLTVAEPAAPCAARDLETAAVLFTQGETSEEVAAAVSAPTQVRVPLSARPGPASFTWLYGSSATSSVSFQVMSPASAAGAAQPGRQELARTGPLLEVLLLAPTGVGLIAAGGWLLVLARPPGQHAAPAARHAAPPRRASASRLAASA